MSSWQKLWCSDGPPGTTKNHTGTAAGRTVKCLGGGEKNKTVQHEKYRWLLNWSIMGFREGNGMTGPKTTDIQVKVERREVGMTELELEAQHERDMRQDAEMRGGTERERSKHKWQRRQNARQTERYRGAQASRQAINHPKNINMYVENNPEASASFREDSWGSLSCVWISSDS